ncbi:cytochrome c/FTR1 family iron permease [Usitatibacter palustris]|uniref:Cytochrome c domain-containing protein n=1 Tax=Usitatibacter palustris TaxID=2732487 RepID=A0A6M4H698_9PROT|nr:cytochrome c/FTR1 family iron permease [Usitatibacter palustris]QJR15156.1 hypothetical protein DSM104440_01973 [Usitatibacter palustris]
MRGFAALAFALGLLAALPLRAQDASQVVHLLDYIAVDYSEAVADGKIKDEGEYKEMLEFAGNVSLGLAKLGDHADKSKLVVQAGALAKLIDAKAAPVDVSAAAVALRQSVVTAYRVVVGPKRAPDLAKGRALFAQHCATCHGADGRGDGPLAKGMDPAPSNFHERERQEKRSVHGLFNTISLGVGGTAMRSFNEIPEADRWALAYVAAGWGISDDEVARGKMLWEAKRFHDSLGTHAAVAGRSATEVGASLGKEAIDVLAYLRRNPAVLDAGKPGPIAFARDRLAESLALHGQGKIDAATQAALTAYLEGFELVEAAVATVDASLVRRVESLMIDYRNLLKSGAPHRDVEVLAAKVDDALEDAAKAISGTALSPTATAAASFVILLREGLEAVLVVVALLAFLRRGGQSQAVPYLHAGWIAALVAGGITWFVASKLIAVSGADRETTEGVTALIAAAMLLYVGFWLHDKSHAQAWQGFLMRGAGSLKSGAAWGLALMAFLAVYREVFETVLFYEALWTQASDPAAIGIGFVAAAITLAAITWAILRYSLRLPLGLFFGASGILLAILAVVLAGNGVAALQEAGLVPVTPVDFVTIGWLGIHPNGQSLGLQAVLLVVVFALFRRGRLPR